MRDQLACDHRDTLHDLTYAQGAPVYDATGETIGQIEQILVDAGTDGTSRP